MVGATGLEPVTSCV